jgi:quercetin dioxygenase-like cupin family protein
MIINVPDGMPVVHRVNDKTPVRNMGLVLLYIAPHAVLEQGSHETQETDVILKGAGHVTFTRNWRDVSKDDLVYLRRGACTVSRTPGV